MTTIPIPLSTETERRLIKLAKQMGYAPEDMAHKALLWGLAELERERRVNFLDQPLNEGDGVYRP